MKNDYHSMMETLTLSSQARTSIENTICAAGTPKSFRRPLGTVLAALCLMLLLPITALGIACLAPTVELGLQEITPTHAAYTVVAEVAPKSPDSLGASLREDLHTGSIAQIFHKKTALEAYLGFPLINSPALEEAGIVENLETQFRNGFNLRPQFAADPSARYILTAVDWEGSSVTNPDVLKISCHRVVHNTTVYLDAWIVLDSVTMEQLEEGILGESFPPVTGWTHEFVYDEEGKFVLDEKGFPVQEHTQFTSTNYTFTPSQYRMPNGCTATVVTAQFVDPDGTKGHREYVGYFLHDGILYTVRPYSIYDQSLDFPMLDSDSKQVLLEVLDSFQ